MPVLRFRQIHLDFHTSELIEGIGAQFDPDEYAATLEKARVDSVSTFARCHHGMVYYDTKAFPERRHPRLTRNLLKEQIDACHARNIRVPIYITVQWDHFTANQHPEWICCDEKGAPMGTPTFQAGFYREMCVNSPYRDFLKAFTKEVLETFPTDGIFFDIVRPLPCACPSCRAKMVAKGLEPSDAAVRASFGLETINEFKRDMTAFVRRFNKDCTLFYNAGHIGPRHRAVADAYTHWELESLPSGGWGYTHFSQAMHYARTLGLDCLGMTGKFHTSWGDFHSFKNLAALQFECFRMLALGAKCSIGDQLHPSGKIDQHVYDLIGTVYREVEKSEPWCVGATPLADVGVITPEGASGDHRTAQLPSVVGVLRMLEESGQQFDIIDTLSDLAPYKVIILPDAVPVSPALAIRIERYLAAGGSLIASFESGLNEEKRAFALSALGVTLRSNPTRDMAGQLVRGRVFPAGDYIDYILPTGAIGKGLPETEHAMYIRGAEVDAHPDSDVLAHMARPYFDRTYKHFCSHRQTPSSGETGLPAIVRKERSIYFAHPIFTQYNQNAPRWCKTLFQNALALLLPEPLVRHSGPSTLNVALNEQKAQQRLVLHALHYIPERRGVDFDVIEDIIPLYNVSFSVQVGGRTVASVACVPDGTALAFEQKDGRVEFVLPALNGRQMIEIKYYNAER